MNERIDQVTIVGGGSAGWIMGLVLTTLLNKADKDRVKVTLIESPRIPNIRVGEGTLMGFSHLLRKEPWETMLARVAAQKPKLMQQLKPHREYLDSLNQSEPVSGLSYSKNYKFS